MNRQNINPARKPYYLPTNERPLTFQDEFCKPRDDRLVYTCQHYGSDRCFKTCNYAKGRGDNNG